MRGIICLPYLANVRCMTSPPTRGNIFWPHLAEVRCVTRPSKRGKFTFYAKLGQHQLLDMRYSSFIVDFFNAYSMSVTSDTTYMASFTKRPNITGAPNQVFKFAISWSVWLGASKPIQYLPSALSIWDLYVPNSVMPLRSISTLPATPLPSLETLPTKWASSVWPWLTSHPFVSFLTSRIRQLWMPI